MTSAIRMNVTIPLLSLSRKCDKGGLRLPIIFVQFSPLFLISYYRFAPAQTPSDTCSWGEKKLPGSRSLLKIFSADGSQSLLPVMMISAWKQDSVEFSLTMHFFPLEQWFSIFFLLSWQSISINCTPQISKMFVMNIVAVNCKLGLPFPFSLSIIFLSTPTVLASTPEGICTPVWESLL